MAKIPQKKLDKLFESYADGLYNRLFKCTEKIRDKIVESSPEKQDNEHILFKSVMDRLIFEFRIVCIKKREEDQLSSKNKNQEDRN